MSDFDQLWKKHKEQFIDTLTPTEGTQMRTWQEIADEKRAAESMTKGYQKAHPLAPEVPDTGGLVEPSFYYHPVAMVFGSSKPSEEYLPLYTAAELSRLRSELESAKRMYRSSCSRTDHAEASLAAATEDNKRLREAACGLVERYDAAMANQEHSQPDMKLAIMANFGDLALGLLRRAALTLAKGEQP